MSTGTHTLTPRVPADLHEAADGEFASSHPGQFAVSEVALPGGQRVALVSLYGIWDLVKGTRDRYVEASLHRAISDLSVLFQAPGADLVVVAGDLNSCTYPVGNALVDRLRDLPRWQGVLEHSPPRRATRLGLATYAQDLMQTTHRDRTIVKTILATATAALLLLSGCGASGDTSTGASASTTASSSQATASPDEEAPASDADYVVTIDGSKQIKDYEGKPALVVNFTFTNNSDKAANFAFAVSAKAFQDGVELETAIAMDDKNYKVEDSLKDIKPGKSIKTQSAYVLDGKSDVTIEVKELISFDDTMLATKTFAIK